MTELTINVPSGQGERFAPDSLLDMVDKPIIFNGKAATVTKAVVNLDGTSAELTIVTDER